VIVSRRGFLATAATAAVGVGALGTGGCVGPAKAPPLDALGGDLDTAGLLAGLENLLVLTYQAAASAGPGPSVVTTFIQSASNHHREHANTWNGLLVKAGRPAVTGPDTTLAGGLVDPARARVRDVVGWARLLLELEDVAAATYVSALATVQGRAPLATAASVQPVEMQHAAVLRFLLGDYPVPAAFASTDGARTTSDQLG